MIAFCHLSLDPSGRLRLSTPPFADERGLQAAFAPRIGGRLRIAAGTSHGGDLDALGVLDWEPGEVIASLEIPGEREEPPDEDPGILRSLMLAGRRMAWAVDVGVGLLPGWHHHARAWWGDHPDEMSSLVSAGICDATGVVRGDHSGFVEMFEAAAFPAHLIHISEHPLAPCAPILLDQLERTAAQRAAIAADLRRAFADSSITPTPDDWIFLGALLAQLGPSPLIETHDLLTASGLARSRQPGWVLLSLAAEPRSVMRHRTLGYPVQVFQHDQSAAGPAARAWLASAFEPVPRSLDDIGHDIVRLADALEAKSGARLLVLNKMSSSGRESICSYTPFDPPLADTLHMVAAKSMNLMLHDLEDAGKLSVVDLDAIAAELGGATHLPDEIHQSGVMQAALRTEILRLIRS